MGAAQKILAGLKEALRFSRCAHSYSPWSEVIHYGDARMHLPREWRRTCAKCETTVTRFSNRQPKN